VSAADQTSAPRRTLRLAHRGDWRVAPENSLEAMQAALRIPGCDGLELDVRASSDGVPILLHDASLKRVQGVAAVPSALTAAECAGHGISLLGEVLAAIGCDPFLDVELKERVPGVIDALEIERGRIDDEGRPELRNTVVSSFDAGILAWLRHERPSWPRWLNALALTDATIQRARRLQCTAISVRWRGVDARSVRLAQAAGLDVAAWTVRDIETYRWLEGLGVVAICAEDAALDG
jgi:glycerophosphoryl diester phosphodiesterase